MTLCNMRNVIGTAPSSSLSLGGFGVRRGFCGVSNCTGKEFMIARQIVLVPERTSGANLSNVREVKWIQE